MTNQLLSEPFVLKDEELLSKKDLVCIICISLNIDINWIDKKFMNRILHGNYISAFNKEFSTGKLEKNKVHQRIVDLSFGGHFYESKFFTKCPMSHVKIIKHKSNASKESCASCNKNDCSLFFCRKCFLIKYCSAECLANDINQHKEFCSIKHKELISSSIPSFETDYMTSSFVTNLIEDNIKYKKNIEISETVIKTLRTEILLLESKIQELKRLMNDIITKRGNKKIVELPMKKLIKRKMNKNMLAISKRQVHRRVAEVVKFMTVKSGCDSEINDKIKMSNLAKLFSEVIRSNPNLFQLAFKNHKHLLKLTHQLSPKEASVCHGSTFRTWSARRKFVTVLKRTLNFNPYGSEAKQRMYEKEKISFLEEDNNLISGNILLYKTGKSLSVTPEPYACVTSLKSYIESIVSEALESGKLDLESDLFKKHMQGKIWVVLSADHGGDLKVSSSMKFCVQIFDWKICPYGIYEASDILENQWLFHARYYEELKELVTSGIQILDRNFPIHLFQKGDMKQAFEFLGLGGQCSTFPSRYSLENLEHLKNDHCNGQPHGPNYCQTAELRTMENIEEQYYKNKLKNPTDLRVNAKHFQSVISKPLIPLKSTLMSVPNILHYKLALVMEGHTQIVKILRAYHELDTSHIVEEKQNIRTKHLEDLDELKKDESSLTKRILLKITLLKRLKAYGDKSIMEKISISCEPKKRLNPLFGRWIFPFSCVQCLLTKYDNDINWLQCDTC